MDAIQQTPIRFQCRSPPSYNFTPTKTNTLAFSGGLRLPKLTLKLTGNIKSRSRGGAKIYDSVACSHANNAIADDVANSNGTIQTTAADVDKIKQRSEAKVSPLLASSTLLITRTTTYMDLLFNVEQDHHYRIEDASCPETPVGFIRVQSDDFATQLYGGRRPFVAHITDALKNKLFRISRPLCYINSSIYAEINGKEVGAVHSRWHLWKWLYDVYVGNKKFAMVENSGFTFILKDFNGKVLAQIDRKIDPGWRGLVKELFDNTCRYVIQFKTSGMVSTSGPASQIEELQVARPLTLSERATIIALAISLDFNHFCYHGDEE